MDTTHQCTPGASVTPGPPSGWTPPVAIRLTAPLSCTTHVLGAAATAVRTTYPAGARLTFDGAYGDGPELRVFLYDRALGIVLDGATYLAAVDEATARGTLGASRYRALTGRA
jgi:hypothetical protein